MKIEVEFCKSENCPSQLRTKGISRQHRMNCANTGGRYDADMVKLLAMHGLDSLEGLAGLGDTISE